MSNLWEKQGVTGRSGTSRKVKKRSETDGINNINPHPTDRREGSHPGILPKTEVKTGTILPHNFPKTEVWTGTILPNSPKDGGIPGWNRCIPTMVYPGVWQVYTYHGIPRCVRDTYPPWYTQVWGIPTYPPWYTRVYILVYRSPLPYPGCTSWYICPSYHTQGCTSWYICLPTIPSWVHLLPSRATWLPPVPGSVCREEALGSEGENPLGEREMRRIEPSILLRFVGNSAQSYSGSPVHIGWKIG